MQYFSVILLLFVNSVFAHVGGQTDSVIDVGQTQVKFLYTLPGDSLLELDKQQPIDPQAPLTTQSSAAIQHAFSVHNNDNACPVSIDSSSWMTSIPSVKIELTAHCNEPLAQLRVQYDLFLDKESEHENNVVVYLGNDLSRLVFSQQLRFFELDISELMRTTGMISDDEFSDIHHKQNYFSDQPDISYFTLGAEHIISGYDHLLFLFTLLLIPLNWRQIVLLVSTFTLAHSISLALATLDVIRFASAVVEAAIAASIIYIALENIWRQRWSQPSAQIKTLTRLLTTFVIGLIHGLGFSGFLSETGLGDNPVSALLYFNIGVEAGQLLMIMPMVTGLYLLRRVVDSRKVNLTLSLLVTLMGAYWLAQRL